MPLIIFAQATTVLGLPLLAASLLYLSSRSRVRTPRWILVLVWIGLGVALVLAVRKAWGLWLGF